VSRRRFVRENAYRDVWLLAITVIVLLGFKAIEGQNDEIQEGRKATAGITCAVSAAVVKGGKLTIVTSAEAPLPPKLEAFLRKYGYPSKAERQASAKATGDAYAQFINGEIIAAAGAQASKVLEPARFKNGRPNPRAGELNCKRLRALAKVR
jgi:hypothetical protein